ncbi:DUF916 domain-containing protein [Lederbergia graminis]|uniref:WxL protein peptidoglycan domain-containing protein n=1 Tax=Lederbergia graminis TaxID=735518 RepID=A0ABW0LCW8_9BACI
MKFFYSLFVTLVTVFFLIPSLLVNADENIAPIIVEPIYPDNQIKSTKGYFDLIVDEKSSQSLNVRIKNNQNKTLIVYIEAANAYTNPKGGIMYEAEMSSPHTSLLSDAIQLKDYITVTDSVIIPPYSQTVVPLTLQVPETNAATILGGVRFKTINEDAKKDKVQNNETANFILKTESVHAIAIQLSLPNETKPDFTFGSASFSPENKGEILLEMINNAHYIQKDINGTYIVSDERENTLFSGEFQSIKMAPKSKINFPISWNHSVMEDGMYTLEIKVNINGIEVLDSKTFSIKQKDVQEYIEKNGAINPNVKVTEKTALPVWIWLIAGFLFGLIMYLIGRRKNTT